MIRLPRRRFLRLAASTAAFSIAPGMARAQTYPSRLVRIIVGFPAGIAPDVTTRLVAQSLSERLGQQVIVDNRPGAGSNIAAEAVVRAPPDGYTLLAVTVANTINADLSNKKLSFDLMHDIAPVAGTFRSPQVIAVTSSFPAKTPSRVHRLCQGQPQGKSIFPPTAAEVRPTSLANCSRR